MRRVLVSGGAGYVGRVLTRLLAQEAEVCVADLMSQVSGVHFIVSQEPSRVRAVDRPFLGADIRRIKRRFGWAPRYDLEATLKEIWRDPDLSHNLKLPPEAASLTAAE